MPSIKHRGKALYDYKADIETLRHYVSGFTPDDGYDLRRLSHLTPSQKRKITIDINRLKWLISRPVKVVRARNKTRLNIMQKEFHGGINIKGLKVALIPVSDPEKPAKITIDRKGRVSVKQAGVNRKLINIDPVLLSRDAISAVNNAIKDSKSKRFGIQAGIHRVESRGAMKNGILTISPRHLIANNVAKLVEKYGSDNYDSENSGSHHFSNWLFGIIALDYEEIKDNKEYQAAFDRQRDLIKRSPIKKRFAMLSKQGRKK